MLADSTTTPSDPMYVVACWNSEHTRRKFFKSYPERSEAEAVRKALRTYGIEAEILPVGETLPVPE